MSEEEGPCPSHIVVLVNGRMFSFNSIGANGEPYTPPVLEKVLSDIKQTAYTGSAGPALGRLTTLPREDWFQVTTDILCLTLCTVCCIFVCNARGEELLVAVA